MGWQSLPTPGKGVVGSSVSEHGVFGQSQSSRGVGGISETDIGVFGVTTSGQGIRGHASGTNGIGVLGTAESGRAGRFEGTVEVKIDRPSGTGIGLKVETSLNVAATLTTTAPASTALVVNQRGSGHLMVGLNVQSAEVFRVTNSGDVQVRGVTLACDKNVKDDFSCVKTREVLEKLAGMPIREWHYKTDPTSIRHIGPTSQDFQAAFELNGDDETNIASVDAQGIALAAIQGLNEKVNAENTQLRAELVILETRLAALEFNLRAAGTSHRSEPRISR
jgi:hypothetical protein